MPKIHRLPDQLANQIAAGEVIERPASAIKELVENALDAGASRIDVNVGEGGRSVRVTDNGSGMEAADALAAFERFATSKVSHVDDLFALTTMGFRGEALASIAAVARVELRTRCRGEHSGTLVRIEGGTVLEQGPCGTPEGTTIGFENLFFNTPARLKFMKSPATEVGHVVEAVTALALAHPTVAMTVTTSGRRSVDTTGARDLAEAASLILGPEIGPAMLACSAQGDAGNVSGLVAPPELIRGDRARQWLFVNGRPVRHPALARAVDEAYAGHIPGSRHPIYALALQVDPQAVDFNVHPTKKEIRLRDAAALYSLVREAVSRGLRQVPAESSRSFLPAAIDLGPSRTPTPDRRSFALTAHQVQESLNLYRPPLRETPAPYSPEAQAGAPGSSGPQAFPLGGRHSFPWDDLVLLGQLHDTYLVLQHPEGLYLIDQHNSHERYLYETLGSGPVAAQELLIPKVLDLASDSASVVVSQLSTLEGLGFRLEPLGDGCWQVRAVPALLPAEGVEGTLLALLAEAADGGGASDRQLSDRWRVTLACHSATKAGDRLTRTAIERLIAQWRTCEQPFTCPHGRPTAILIPLAELHRRCMRGMQTR